MGVWLGGLDADGDPVTIALEKIDLFAVDVAKKNRPPIYDATIAALDALPCFPGRIRDIVVETQAPQNMPARIAATALYAYARGRGIPVAFSGSRLKREALEAMAAKKKVVLKPQPTKEQQPDAAKRRRQMHAVNKDNATAVASALLAGTRWGEALDGARDPRCGRKKEDDMADALLLGIGACLVAAKKAAPRVTIRSRRKKFTI